MAQVAREDGSSPAGREFVDRIRIIVRHEKIAAGVECQAIRPIQTAGEDGLNPARRKFINRVGIGLEAGAKRLPLRSNAKSKGRPNPVANVDRLPLGVISSMLPVG